MHQLIILRRILYIRQRSSKLFYFKTLVDVQKGFSGAMHTDSVKTFFSGKSVFLTGGTGFMGKVLIEKILRSCPEIDKIYILIRSKRGKLPQERANDITNVKLFDTLKEKYPDAIKTKLKPVLGDVSELGLGLSEADKKELIDNVSIIYHAAASVRFDDPLKKAILLNTRGTREIVQLGLEMKRLEVFVYISTTYSNSDQKVVEERLYPPHADWKKSIEIAENLNEHELEIFTAKYIGELPNTYTFTKSLSEHVVVDMCTGKIPAVIYRPSIVIATRSDPIPAWTDNLNGPVGILIACGKGILRTIYANPNTRSDYIPVDIITRSLLIATWQKGIASTEKKLDVDFYNGSNNNLHALTMKEIIDIGKEELEKVPFNNIIWCPGGGITQSKLWNYMKVIFLHLLPAILVDCCLRLVNKKPILFKIQKRIYIANMALQYFVAHEWTFQNDKCLELEKKLLPSEYDEFGYDFENIDVREFFKNSIVYGRQYVLKGEELNTAKAKQNLRRMYLLDKFVKIMVYVLMYWILVHKMNIPVIVGNKIWNQIFESYYEAKLRFGHVF